MNKKIALKIGAASIIAILSIVVVSYFILHQPKYTLYKIKNALGNHDWESFSQYVDVDALYTSFVDEVANDDHNSLGSSIAKAMAGVLKETAISRIKQEVENPNNAIGETKFLEHFSLPDSIKQRIVVIKSGKIASVRIFSKHGLYDIPSYIEIRMRSEGFKYVVIGVNTENIKQRDRIVTDAMKQYFLIPAKKKFDSAVTITFSKKYKDCANSFYGSCFEDLVMIEREIQNNSGKDISSLEYQIWPEFSTDDDECRYAKDENIKAGVLTTSGKTRGWKYNQFINSQRRLLDIPLSEVKYKPAKITFFDGEIIEIDDLAYLNFEKAPNLSTLGEFMKSNNLLWGDSVVEWSRF
jgi:hypothetical protein